MQWKDVDIVLERLREELVGPARTVRAELHKVLVYRKGDFFNLHYDSKKAPNHALSLSVDTGLAQCSGGVTLFPGPCRPNDKEDGKKSDLFRCCLMVRQSRERLAIYGSRKLLGQQRRAWKLVCLVCYSRAQCDSRESG